MKKSQHLLYKKGGNKKVYLWPIPFQRASSWILHEAANEMATERTEQIWATWSNFWWIPHNHLCSWLNMPFTPPSHQSCSMSSLKLSHKGAWLKEYFFLSFRKSVYWLQHSKTRQDISTRCLYIYVYIYIYTHIFKSGFLGKMNKITIFSHICVFIKRHYSKPLILTKKAAFLGNLREEKPSSLYR